MVRSGWARPESTLHKCTTPGHAMQRGSAPRGDHGRSAPAPLHGRTSFVLPHPGRARLSPLARTTLLLTVASGALALTPVPSATSLPLPAVTHTAAVHPAGTPPRRGSGAHKGSTGNLVMAIQIKVGQHRTGSTARGPPRPSPPAAPPRAAGDRGGGPDDVPAVTFPPAAATYRTGVQTIGDSVLGRPIAAVDGRRLTHRGAAGDARRCVPRQRAGGPADRRPDWPTTRPLGMVAYFIVRDPNRTEAWPTPASSKQAQEA